MAKNISLLGAEYPDVPAVQLPQTGGGTATFYDINVVDNLNSDSSTDALSAKQGKVLNDKITQLNNNVIVESAGQDPIVSVTDGADGMPLRSLSVDIDPVQDLHGYENPWPGGGGKNLLETTGTTTTLGSIKFTVNDDGSVTVNGTDHYGNRNFLIGYVRLSEAKELILNGAPSGSSESTCYLAALNESLTEQIGADTGNGVNVGSQTAIAVRIRVIAGTTVNNAVFKPMVRLASVSDATFAPYSNICPISGWTGCNVSVSPTTDPDDPDKEVYSITFPQAAGTVYGGTLTVNQDGTGTLVVDRGYKTFNGTEDWQWMSNDSLGKAYVSGGVITDNDTQFLVLTQNDTFADKSWTQRGAVDGTVGMFYGSSNIYLKYSKFENEGDIKTYLASNNLHVVYELATPVTYNLTDLEVIETLKGVNNVWSNTGNIISVTYPADTKLYIDKKFAELQALILENISNT